MKTKMHNRLLLNFSILFLVMLVSLIAANFWLLDDFYLSANKRMMTASALEFEPMVHENGPQKAVEHIKGSLGAQALIVSQNAQQPLAPTDAKLIEGYRAYVTRSQSNERGLYFIKDERTDSMVLTKRLENGDTLLLIKKMGLAEEASKLFFQFMLRASIVIYLIGCLLIWFMAKRISRPIEQLNRQTIKLSNLDFDALLDIDRSDELGSLAQSVNKMSTALKRAMDQLRFELDEEKRMEVMRKQFVSNVSHELKNPLSMIQGYADGLLHGVAKTDEAKSKYHQVIFSESVKMNTLINDLLDLSSYESGVFQLQLEVVDFSQLTRESVEVFKTHFNDKGISLNDQIHDQVHVTGDALRISQVVINLLSNALKYTPIDGSVIVELKKDESVRFTVKSTGPLLSKEELADIWTSFYQVNSVTSGSGLGLAIVKSIVELHGGTVSASTDGEYNIFSITFS